MKNSNAVRECQHIRRPAAISTVSQSVPRMWKVWHCWSWNGNSVKIHLNSHRFLTGCTNTPPGSANTTCPWVWCDQSANGRVWPHPNSGHLVPRRIAYSYVVGSWYTQTAGKHVVLLTRAATALSVSWVHYGQDNWGIVIRFSGGAKIFLPSTASKPTLRHTLPLYNVYPATEEDFITPLKHPTRWRSQVITFNMSMRNRSVYWE